MALLQHFSLPGVLEQRIAKARGDLRARIFSENWRCSLVKRRDATGLCAARSGASIQHPSVGTAAARSVQIDQVTEPHDRGAILVAAVFDAFLTSTSDVPRPDTHRYRGLGRAAPGRLASGPRSPVGRRGRASGGDRYSTCAFEPWIIVRRST